MQVLRYYAKYAGMRRWGGMFVLGSVNLLPCFLIFDLDMDLSWLTRLQVLYELSDTEKLSLCWMESVFCVYLKTVH